jgi:hypothetical protein
VAADAVTVTVTLSDGNSEPLSLSARQLPVDSGPGSSKCDGSRAAGWVAAGPTGLKFPKSHTKNKFPEGSKTFVHAE